MKYAIDAARVNFELVEQRPGIWTINAYASPFVSPVGTVWFVHVARNVIEIHDSYVTKNVRRQGVRTAIHRAMLRWYPKTSKVVTASASGKASRRWLSKTGFQKTDCGYEFDVAKQGEIDEASTR